MEKDITKCLQCGDEVVNRPMSCVRRSYCTKCTDEKIKALKNFQPIAESIPAKKWWQFWK